jgi:hypothetical protein
MDGDVGEPSGQPEVSGLYLLYRPKRLIIEKVSSISWWHRRQQLEHGMHHFFAPLSLCFQEFLKRTLNLSVPQRIQV